MSRFDFDWPTLWRWRCTKHPHHWGHSPEKPATCKSPHRGSLCSAPVKIERKPKS